MRYFRFGDGSMTSAKVHSMSTIRKFFLRDVRCFAGEHEFHIRPLTFLVGENSTGKSTILGCFQALGNFLSDRTCRGSFGVDFNSDPYQMGTFADIVRKSRPLIKKFQLGIDLEGNGKDKEQFFLSLAEKERGAEPIIRGAKWVLGEGEIVFSRSKENHSSSKNREFPRVRKGRKQNQFYVSIPKGWFSWIRFYFHDLYHVLSFSRENLDDASQNLLQFMDRYFRSRPGSTPVLAFRPCSIAPIRSKPRRTYDPLKELETSGGNEIPMMLLNLKVSDKGRWENLRERLLRFGTASGLFADIAIRELGRSKSDPFQLQIKVRGPKSNLMDVGYGVSQALPILVRILSEKNHKFLLQQPEIHLHPKGQAELASLLVGITASRQNSFIIETHSDHMIDRVRIEIMKGKIKPDDVSLIYLEPVGNRVRTHNISFDGQANMNNVPKGYRDFFLDESNKLLGFSKD